MSFRALGVVAVVLALASCRSASSDAPALATPEERFSYSVGAKLGDELRRGGQTLDRELVVRGLEAGLAGSSVLSDAEISAALQEGVERQREREAALREERARAAQQEGRTFLATNRTRSGVVELEGGVQYEVLQQGNGPVPGIEDFVTCNSRGTLLDGSVFDDTAALGRPRTFAVTSVVDGLEQALLRMPVGSRWRIWVPAELGYGAAGARSKVPPYSTLVFEVELLAIAPPPKR